MTLKVGFGKPKAFFVPLAWAIALVEGTKYTHTYFRYPTADGERVFQSLVSSGVNDVAIEDFKKSYQVMEEYPFELDGINTAKYYAFMAKYKGRPYGFWQLVGIWVARTFGLKKNPFSRGEDKMICAELLDVLIKQMPDVFAKGLSVEAIQDPDSVGLKQMHDIVVEAYRA